MAHPSKRKGNHFERELVNQAKELGLPAQRAYASNGEALGMHAEVDCLIAGNRVQAKRRASLASYLLPSEHVDVVIARADHGEAVVVMRLSDWLSSVKSSLQGEDAE